MKYRKMQQSKFGLPVTATGSTQKGTKGTQKDLGGLELLWCEWFS